jgi:hypothetical protein
MYMHVNTNLSNLLLNDSTFQMPYSSVDELMPESPSILHGDTIMRNLDDIGNSMKVSNDSLVLRIRDMSTLKFLWP